MSSFRETQRQLERAEAEVAALRRMVRALADTLDAVPSKSWDEMRLVQEAITLAGSTVRR